MKNILISGGAGEIGKHIVREFVKNNDRVYVIDTDKKGLEELVLEMGEAYVIPIALSVTDVAALQQYSSSLGNSFSLDHIITLAGRALEGEWIKFEKQDLNVIHRSMDLNLLGHINVIHTFYPYLKKSKEDKSVLMISSINALSNYGLPGYSAAKSGLVGLMNAVVDEFGADGIRINVLSPGTVVTPATLKEPKNFEALLEGTAMRRFVTPEEVAALAYQMSSTFRSMTGHNVVLDAGQSKMHLK